MPDGYEIAAGFAADANVNGLVDLCEIRAGLALDVDNDWIPDDAQVPAMAGALPGAEGVPAAYAAPAGHFAPMAGSAMAGPMPSAAPAGFDAPAGAAVPDPFDPWAAMPRYGMRP